MLQCLMVPRLLLSRKQYPLYRPLFFVSGLPTLLNMILSSLAALSLVATSFASPLDSVKRASSGISAITDAQWAELNQTVAGKLHKGAPWARPCFALATSGTNGNFDLGQCTAVQSGWTDDLQIVRCLSPGTG